MYLAEGCGRENDADFRRSLSAAMGGGSQLEYLLLALDLGFLPQSEHSRLTADAVEVKRMIAGLIHSLNG